MSLALNKKLDMIKLNEEGMSRMKAKTGQKPLGPVSQVLKAKEKFLKETESAAPGNTQMMRKQNSLIADMEELQWSGQKIKPATAFP